MTTAPEASGTNDALGTSRGAMFRSLRSYNYRLYFAGQMVSMAGTFMQTVAQAWLVLELTGNGTALGLVTTLQFAPILLLGGPAGVLADRVDRRRLFLVTQSLAGLEALVLGLLVITGHVELWMVYVLAAVLGLITAVDSPVRQAFVLDIVGPADLPNAISLNMSLNSTSRAVGPALAGVVIAVFGVGPCFLVNAASFAGVIVALLLMNKSELHRAPRQPRRPGQFRAGLGYVKRSRDIASILLLVAFFFGLAWEFEVALPLMARYAFDGNAATFGILSSAVGLGSVLGGLEAARRGRPTRGALLVSAAVFTVALWGATFAPSVTLEIPVLLVAGGAGIAFASAGNTRIQLRLAPEMRGRIMGLWVVAVTGTRVVGGPIVGWFGEHVGPRAALGIGAFTVSVVAPLWYLATRDAASAGGKRRGDLPERLVE